MLLPDGEQSPRAVGLHPHLEALEAQLGGDELGDVGLVLDDEDAGLVQLGPGVHGDRSRKREKGGPILPGTALRGGGYFFMARCLACALGAGLA
ncbi:hypothetical protein D3C86_1096720 [compost metagenome]